MSSWRLRSVMKIEGSAISTPWSRAKREAPSAASRTYRPSSITARARSIGCLTSFKHAAPPARSSAPSMTPASSSTSPSLFRQAPMPALRRGSSSMCRTAATAAARAPPPMADQPTSRARSTADCRSSRSASGTGPAPPWTISAGRANRRCLVGLRLWPQFAALDEAAFRDAAVEGVQHAPARARPLGFAAFDKATILAGSPLKAGSTLGSARYHIHPRASGDANARDGRASRAFRQSFAPPGVAPARRPVPGRQSARTAPVAGAPRPPGGTSPGR